MVQVFSCEFGKIFMSTFFIEPLWWLQQFAAAQQTSTTKLLVFFKSFKKQCAFNNQTRQAKNSSILTIVTALRYLIYLISLQFDHLEILASVSRHQHRHWHWPRHPH